MPGVPDSIQGQMGATVLALLPPFVASSPPIAVSASHWRMHCSCRSNHVCCSLRAPCTPTCCRVCAPSAAMHPSPLSWPCSVRAGRLECTMQNLADSLTTTLPARLRDLPDAQQEPMSPSLGGAHCSLDLPDAQQEPLPPPLEGIHCLLDPYISGTRTPRCSGSKGKVRRGFYRLWL